MRVFKVGKLVGEGRGVQRGSWRDVYGNSQRPFGTLPNGILLNFNFFKLF
jgi:hypothetical protein